MTVDSLAHSTRVPLYHLQVVPDYLLLPKAALVLYIDFSPPRAALFLSLGITALLSFLMRTDSSAFFFFKYLKKFLSLPA